MPSAGNDEKDKERDSRDQWWSKHSDSFYLLCFGLLLIGVRQRLLLWLQRRFGEEVLKLVGVGDVRLVQGSPQRVVAVREKIKDLLCCVIVSQRRCVKPETSNPR